MAGAFSIDRKAARWWIAFLLLSAAVFPYAHTLTGGFIWDDTFLIESNPAIRSLDNPIRFFSPSYWAVGHPGTPGQYRPIRILTFAASYALWKLDPLGYRITNLALYVVVVWLVYVVARRVVRNEAAALLAGLFFALHPAHTEAVAWIKNRSEVISCLFVMLGFWGFLKKEEDGSRWGYALSIAAFPLAVLSKEIAIVYPLLLGAWVLHGRPPNQWRGSLAQLWPHAALLAGYGIFLFGILGGRIQSSGGSHMPFSQHLFMVLWSWWVYLRDLFFPVYFNAEHLPPALGGLGHPLFWASAAVMCALVWIWRRSAKNGAAKTAFSIAWIPIALLPVLNIRLITGRPLADQRVFLASVGTSFLAARAFVWLLEARYPGLHRSQIRVGAWTLLAVVLAAMLVQTHVRNRVWRDPVALYEDTVAKSPRAFRAHYNLAYVYASRGEWERAVRSYRMALAIRPDDEGTHNNLGLVYFSKGDYQRAEREYLIARKIDPKAVGPNLNLGILYKEMGRYAMAEARLKEALLQKPDLSRAYLHLGDIHVLTGRWQEAEADYQRVLAREPRNITARMQLAQLYSRLGRWHEGLRVLGEVLAIDGANVDAMLLRTELLTRLGQTEAAGRALARAARESPRDPRISIAEGRLAEQAGDLESAKRSYMAALSIDPGSPLAHLRLGALLREEGKLSQAERHLKLAQTSLPDDPEVHLQLARLYLERKDTIGKAMEHLQQVLKRFPNHPQRKEIQTVIETLRESKPPDHSTAEPSEGE